MDQAPAATTTTGSGREASGRGGSREEGVIFAFGTYRFDPRAGSLHRDGRRVALRPQQGKALTLLVERCGEVVSRDELRVHLWGRETYLDVEAGLNTCMRRLRATLADDASEPRFIQTVQGEGYRFVAPVRRLAQSGDAGKAERFPETPAWRRRAAGWTATAALLLTAALIVPAVDPRHEAPESSDGTPVVLFAGFDNRSGEELLDDSLAGAFRIGLAQSSTVQLLTAAEVESALRRMQRDPAQAVRRRLGLEICQREGAEALVLAAVSKLGGRYQLQAEVVDAETGRTTFAASRTVSGQGELLTAVAELVGEVRRALGDSLDGTEVQRLAQVTTTDLRALKDYSKALVVRATDPSGAATLLERALGRDPDFAMAHAVLAVVERNRGDVGRAKEHLAAALRRADRLTEYEKLYVRGHLAMIDLDGDTAIETWSLMRRVFPGKLIGYYNHAHSLRIFRNDFPGCVAILEGRTQRRRDTWELGAALHRGSCLLGSERLDEALAAARNLYASRPRLGAWLLVDALLARGLGAEAERVIDEVETAPGVSLTERYASSLARAALRASEGRFAAAAEAARDARERSPELGAEARLAAWLTRLAYLEAAGDGGALGAELASASRLVLGDGNDPGLVAEVRQPTPALSLLGSLAARHGEVELAERCRRRLRETWNGRPVPALWRVHRALLDAEILLARGDAAGAKEGLESRLEAAQVAPLHATGTLARWQGRLGERADAAARWRRLAAAPGRAVAECLGGDACLDYPFNLLAHGEASRRVGAGRRNGV